MDCIQMPVNRYPIVEVFITQQIESMSTYFSRLLNYSRYLIRKPPPQ